MFVFPRRTSTARLPQAPAAKSGPVSARPVWPEHCRDAAVDSPVSPRRSKSYRIVAQAAWTAGSKMPNTGSLLLLMPGELQSGL